MNILDRNANLENWFDFNIFEDGEEILHLNMAHKFFNDTFIDFFLKTLDLQDIIALSKVYKNVAYMAYNNNIANFQRFCDEVWYRSTLDFSYFKKLTIPEFLNIQRLFFAGRVIFTSALPSDFLNYLYIGYEYVFYPRQDVGPLMRVGADGLPMIRNPRITVYNSIDEDYNQLYEILATYEIYSKLDLRGVQLTTMLLLMMRAVEIRQLVLRDIRDGEYSLSTLLDTIIESGSHLEELTITNHDNKSKAQNIIRHLWSHLHKLKYLRKLTVSISLTHSNLNDIRQSIFPKSL